MAQILVKNGYGLHLAKPKILRGMPLCPQEYSSSGNITAVFQGVEQFRLNGTSFIHSIMIVYLPLPCLLTAPGLMLTIKDIYYLCQREFCRKANQGLYTFKHIEVEKKHSTTCHPAVKPVQQGTIRQFRTGPSIAALAANQDGEFPNHLPRFL